MDNLQEKIDHLISLIPEDYDKRDELLAGLEEVPSEDTWVYVARLFVNVCGLGQLLDSKNVWLKELQEYWAQFNTDVA